MWITKTRLKISFFKQFCNLLSPINIRRKEKLTGRLDVGMQQWQKSKN